MSNVTYLWDDPNVSSFVTQLSFDVLYVFSLTDERGKHHVDAMLNTKTKVILERAYWEELIREQGHKDEHYPTWDSTSKCTVTDAHQGNIHVYTFTVFACSDTVLDHPPLSNYHRTARSAGRNSHHSWVIAACYYTAHMHASLVQKLKRGSGRQRLKYM